MNIYSYWIGNFIYDYFLYAIVAGFTGTMCMVFDIQSLTGGDAMGGTWTLILLFGLANLPLTYILTFLFKDYSSAQAGIYFFNFICGGILSTLALVLRTIADKGGAGEIVRGFSWVLRLIPAYSFGEGLSNEGSISILSIYENKGVMYEVWDWEIVLAPVVYMAVGVVGYFGVLFAVE